MRPVAPEDLFSANSPLRGGGGGASLLARTPASSSPGGLPAGGPIDDIVSLEASKYGIEPSLVRSLVKTESGGKPDATSFKGASGIMQIMPDTAKDIAEELGEEYSPMKLKDPATNIRWGTYYLAKNMKKYGGDPRFGLIAYHAGPSGADAVWKTYQSTGVFQVPRTKRFHDGLSYTADYVDGIVKRAGGAQAQAVRGVFPENAARTGQSAKDPLWGLYELFGTKHLFEKKEEEEGAAKEPVAVAPEDLFNPARITASTPAPGGESSPRPSAVPSFGPMETEDPRVPGFVSAEQSTTSAATSDVAGNVNAPSNAVVRPEDIFTQTTPDEPPAPKKPGVLDPVKEAEEMIYRRGETISKAIARGHNRKRFSHEDRYALLQYEKQQAKAKPAAFLGGIEQGATLGLKKPDPATARVMEQEQIPAFAGNVVGGVGAGMITGTAARAAMSKVPVFAKLLSAGPAGAIAFNSLQRGVTTASNSAVRLHDDLVSEEPEKKLRAVASLVTGIVGSMVSPIPEAIPGAKALQVAARVGLQPLIDAAVETVGMKAFGQNAWDAENLLSTVTQIATSTMFALNDVKMSDAYAPKAKVSTADPARPETVTEPSPQPKGAVPAFEPEAPMVKDKRESLTKATDNAKETLATQGTGVSAAKPITVDKLSQSQLIAEAKRLNVPFAEDANGNIKGPRSTVERAVALAQAMEARNAAKLAAKPKQTDDASLFETGQRTELLENQAGTARLDLFSSQKTPTGERPVGVLGRAKRFVQRIAQRELTPEGDLPIDVFKAKLDKDHFLNAELGEIGNIASDYQAAVKAHFKKNRIPDKTAALLDQIFKGERPDTDLPANDKNAESRERLLAVIKKMRSHVDAVTQRLIDAGVVEGDLAVKFSENIGAYATRSFRVHDDPNWAKKVPESVRNRAKAFIRQELELSNVDIQSKVSELQGRKLELEEKLSGPLAADQRAKFQAEYEGILSRIDAAGKELVNPEDEGIVNGIIDELLYKDGAPVHVLAQGSKLGSKSLDILKRRKEIPQEIRALWGEYKNADVNYVKSVSKMSKLLANHAFLKEVKAQGLGKFLFEGNPIVKDGQSYSVKIATEGNRSMSPLDGLYTTKEIKKAFEDVASREAVPDWLKLYMKVNSSVKYAKTIGSVMTHVRNVTGNVGFAVANGHFNVTKMAGAVRTTFSDFVGKPAAEQRKYIRELKELGVIGTGARSGEIKAIIQDATQGNLDVLVGTGNKNAVRKALSLIEKAYGAEDDVWKVFAYENELSRYRKALGADVSEAELKKRAAAIVRDTYPTYEMIPRAVRKLRRFPLVGTFVSFPAEVIRTAGNTLGLAAKELADPKLRAIGAQRLTGIILAATATGALTTASRYMAGINKKKDEALRKFMPPWAQNSEIVYTGDGEGGKPTYINLGYTDPHGYLKNAAVALMRGENWQEKVVLSGGELLAPFLSEDILTQKLLNLSRNKTEAGQPVYNPTDTWENISGDVMLHFAEALEPGTLAGARRVYKAYSDQEGTYGTTYGANTELAAQLTGLRINEIDVERSLGFHAYKFNRDLTDVSRLAAKKGEKVSDSQQAKIFAKFQEVVDAARVTGLADDQIKSILSEANLSKDRVRAVLNGTAVTPESVETVNKIVKRVATQGGYLGEVLSELKNRKIGYDRATVYKKFKAEKNALSDR